MHLVLTGASCRLAAAEAVVVVEEVAEVVEGAHLVEEAVRLAADHPVVDRPARALGLYRILDRGRALVQHLPALARVPLLAPRRPMPRFALMS